MLNLNNIISRAVHGYDQPAEVSRFVGAWHDGGVSMPIVNLYLPASGQFVQAQRVLATEAAVCWSGPAAVEIWTGHREGTAA